MSKKFEPTRRQAARLLLARIAIGDDYELTKRLDPASDLHLKIMRMDPLVGDQMRDPLGRTETFCPDWYARFHRAVDEALDNIQQPHAKAYPKKDRAT